MSNSIIPSKLFLEISSLLTGFTETELIATGMLDSYLNTILQNSDKEDVKYFFENVSEILNQVKKTEKSVEHAIRTQLMPDSCYGGLAKSIIILWYTGSLGNTVLSSKTYGQSIVSSDSYIQGLMWDAGYTHPPGAKQPGYGSWAELPVSVQIKDKTKTDGK